MSGTPGDHFWLETGVRRKRRQWLVHIQPISKNERNFDYFYCFFGDDSTLNWRLLQIGTLKRVLGAFVGFHIPPGT